MDYQLQELLQATITIEPYSTRNSDNEFTYSSGVPVSCRVERKIVKTQNKAGDEVTSNIQIYVNGSETVTINDRITLSDGTQPTIYGIVEQPGENRDCYYKCIIGGLSHYAGNV